MSAELGLFVFAGIVGGIVNTLAGGAKLFVFPMLLASGLPPIVANATGTVALWPAQLPALWMHRRMLAGRAGSMVRRILPAIAGALIGAFALVFSSERAFLTIIPFVLVAAVLVISLGNRLPRLVARLIPVNWRRLTTQLLMFATGIYGGYFGAGMGFLLVAVISLAGVWTIQEANFEKNLAATVINTTAVIPLLLSGLVHLPAAGGVLLGGLLGGYLGGWLAGLLPELPMRLLIAGLGLVLTFSFLFR